MVEKSFPRHTFLSFSFEKRSTRGFMIVCQKMFHYAQIVLIVRRELFHQARIDSVCRSTNVSLGTDFVIVSRQLFLWAWIPVIVVENFFSTLVN